MVLLACSKPKKRLDDKPKKEDKPPVAAVGMGAGSTTVYPNAEAKSPSFSLRWKEGRFDVSKGGVDTGHLKGPSGEIYSNGKPTSAYRADKGDADKPANRLRLTDNVVVQSIDKANTLEAKQVEYRGDVKIVRAVGGVTASGPFGTLSGAPELWATPDLRLIGTPDMVSKKLKIPALVALAATAAVGSPKFQKTSDYKLENLGSTSIDRPKEKGGLTVTTLVPVKGATLVLTVLSRGITFRSAGTVLIYSDSKGQAAQRIVTQGAVNVFQAGSQGTTEFEGVGADYRLVPGGSKAKGQDATLKVGGRVTMTNVSKKAATGGGTLTNTTVSKGDRAEALLIVATPQGTAKSEIPVKNAVMTGNVKIDVSGDDGIFSGSGDKLVYNIVPDGAKAVMTGDLRLSGNVPEFIGDARNADTLVVLLNEANEWTNIHLENSTGKPINTGFDPKENPKKAGGKP